MSGSRNASNKRSAILRRDGAYCALCGRFVLGKSRSVDHIMPHREGGTKELDNLRMVHRACNQARDEHYRLNEADTLEHLEALCDLARCVDALYPGVRWRFSRLPDKASPVYEIEVFSVPAEVQLHARRLGRVKSRLEQRYGSYVAFKVTPHADATPFESEDSITVAFSKNDRLTRALQMTAQRHGHSSFVNSVRHAMWRYLAQSEPEIYRAVCKAEYLRIYRPDLVEPDDTCSSPS